MNEHIESLLQTKPDIKKLKAGGRSTNNIHKEKKSEKNFEECVSTLSFYLPEHIVEEYRIENINLISLPVKRLTRTSIIHF